MWSFQRPPEPPPIPRPRASPLPKLWKFLLSFGICGGTSIGFGCEAPLGLSQAVGSLLPSALEPVTAGLVRADPPWRQAVGLSAAPLRGPRSSWSPQMQHLSLEAFHSEDLLFQPLPHASSLKVGDLHPVLAAGSQEVLSAPGGVCATTAPPSQGDTPPPPAAPLAPPGSACLQRRPFTAQASGVEGGAPKPGQCGRCLWKLAPL